MQNFAAFFFLFFCFDFFCVTCVSKPVAVAFKQAMRAREGNKQLHFRVKRKPLTTYTLHIQSVFYDKTFLKELH